MRFEKVSGVIAHSAAVVAFVLLVGFVAYLLSLGLALRNWPSEPEETLLEPPTPTPTPSNLAPAPTGLKVEDVTETTVSLSWDSVPGAHEYLLERSPGIAHDNYFSASAVTVETGHIDDGMDPFRRYYFRVSARGDGTGYVDIFGNLSNIVPVRTLPEIP